MIRDKAQQALKWLEAKQCSQSLMGKAIVWCGVRIFGYMVTWNPPEKGGELRAIQFATSERDSNEFTRTIVEVLDEQYEERSRGVPEGE